jgi:hypothetical protein
MSAIRSNIVEPTCNLRAAAPVTCGGVLIRFLSQMSCVSIRYA